MADDREREQGMKQGTGNTGHQAPGRNPEDDRTAGERGDKGRQQGSQEPGQGSQEDKQAGQRGPSIRALAVTAAAIKKAARTNRTNGN